GNSPWGASSQGSPVPDPELFGLSLGPRATWFFDYGQLPTPVFGLLCLVTAVGLAMVVASLRRSSLGQAMLALRSNERAAAAVGIDVRRIKIVAFGLSSALSGVAGVLYAYNYGSVSASRYTLMLGLTFISFVLMFGVGSVSGTVAAALGAVQGVIVFTVGLAIDLSTNFQLLLGGVGLILTVIVHPDGVSVRDRSKRGQKRGGARLVAGLSSAVGGARSRSAPPAPLPDAEPAASAALVKKEVQS
ncbi:branched-chain amino acid ABC transporter permease, partial [Streptomyces sp. NPDC006356]